MFLPPKIGFCVTKEADHLAGAQFVPGKGAPETQTWTWPASGLGSSAFTTPNIFLPSLFSSSLLPSVPVLGDKSTGFSSGSTAQKNGFHYYETPQMNSSLALPFTLRRLYPHIPEENFRKIGNLRQGMIVFNKDDPFQFVGVATNAFRPKPSTWKIDEDGWLVDVDYGETPHEEHIFSSKLVRTNAATRATIQSVYRQMKDPFGSWEQLCRSGLHYGVLQVGVEREFWREDPVTNQLVHYYGPEGIRGAGEIVDGLFITPEQAALEMAAKTLELEALYPGERLLTTATPMTGDVKYLRANMKAGNPSSYYIAAVNIKRTGLDENGEPRYRPRTDDSQMIRQQMVEASEFYSTVSELLHDKLLGDLWCLASSHLNLGLPHTNGKVDARLALEMANLLNSELGTVIRMMMMGGGISHKAKHKLDGRFIRSAREPIRNDSGMAAEQNQPIRDEGHLLEIIFHMITSGKADRLDRAAAVHVDEDGEMIFTGQGDWRLRITEDGTNSGRFELLGGDSSAILPRARAIAVMQLFGAIVIEAYSKNLSSLDYVADLLGLSSQDVWGRQSKTSLMREFNVYGPNSPVVHPVIQRVKQLFDVVSFPGLGSIQKIARRSMDLFTKEGDLKDLARGEGNLGGAVIPYMSDYTVEQIAEMLRQYFHQEAIFVKNLSASDVTRALLGEIGFEFVPQV